MRLFTAIVVAGALAGLASAAEPPRLVYQGRSQAVGQSDYDFIKSYVPVESNPHAAHEAAWSREQDRIDARYERAAYYQFDAVAKLRGTRDAGAKGLKLQFQRERLQGVEDEIVTLRGQLPSPYSDSDIDRVIRATTNAAIRTAESRRDATRRKIADLSRR